MKIRNLLFVAALLFAFRNENSSAAETNLPTVVIYTMAGRPVVTTSNYVGRLVNIALWSDGKVVWSEPRTSGGFLYKAGKFSPEKLNEFLAALERKDAFKDRAFKRVWLGPDSGFTSIVIHDGTRRLTLQSWHEQFEKRTNLVATARGIEPLAGRNREEVLSQQSEEYRRFRETWSEIRENVAALIPKTGEPYEGEIPIPTNY